MCIPNGSVNFGCIRALGYTLLVTSILSIGLTIADILTTYYICPPSGNGDPNCLPDYQDNFWTWIASGIWTSLPVFILGLWIIGWSIKKTRPGCFHDWFLCLIYFVLVPLMISFTITESVKYRNNYKWANDTFNKLPIPITVTIIGFIEMAILLFIYNEVFCRHWTDEYVEEPVTTVTTSTTPAPVPIINAVSNPNPTPVNMVYPNMAYTSRVQSAIIPAYGIYSPQRYNVLQPQGMRWTSPMFNWPQSRISVNVN